MRLIDADRLLSRYKGNIFTAKTDYAEGLRDVISDIKNAPTVDAVPVVHGHWEKQPLRKFPEEHIDVCSICGSKALAKYNHCPNCGAKMLGGTE